MPIGQPLTLEPMSEDAKAATRLLLEAMDQLRLHDEEYQHRTDPELKAGVVEFLDRVGLGDPKVAAEVLGLPLEDGR